MAARKPPKTPKTPQAKSLPPRADAEKLRGLRERRGLTQEALAARSGFGLRTIRDIEAGRANPNPSTLKTLLDALGATVDEVRPDGAPEKPAAKKAPPAPLVPIFDPPPSRLEHLVHTTHGKPEPAPRATPDGLVQCLTPRAFQQVFSGFRIHEGARFWLEGVVERHRGLSVAEAKALSVKRGLGARFLFAQTIEGAPYKVTVHVADPAMTKRLFDVQGKPALVFVRVVVVEGEEDGRGVFEFFGGQVPHEWALCVERLGG